MNTKSISTIILIIILTAGVTYIVISNNLNEQHRNEITNIIGQYQNTIKNINETNDKISEQRNQFMKDYIIIITDIKDGEGYESFSRVNFHNANREVIGGQYYYNSIVPLYDDSLEQALKSKTIFLATQDKLLKIKNNSPNEFISGDIKLREEQIKYNILLAESRYNMVYNYKQSLYEINYGTKIKSEEYFRKSQDEITNYNSILYNVNIAQQNINKYWDKSWYDIIVVK